MLQQIKILRRPQRCFRASPRHPQRPKGASGDLLRFTCLAAALLCSCSSSQIPLQQFEAANRSYFPPFVTNYFQATEYFTKDFPSLAEARSDIKLIQIRPLNDNVNQQQNETNLSWSADGAFLSYEVMLGNERKILVKNLKGDYTHQLLVLPQGKNTFLDGVIYRAIHSYNAGLSWSKDSTRFAFMSNGGVGEYNIYVGGIGAKEEPVAKSPSKDGYATWNPQGGELAFVSARTGNGDIYLYEFSSQKTKQLSQGNSVDIFPEWSPDGKRVAVMRLITISSSPNAINTAVGVNPLESLNGLKMTCVQPFLQMESLSPSILRPRISRIELLIPKLGTSMCCPWNSQKSIRHST